MIEITSICKIWGKRASHFTDNRKLDTSKVVARGGINGNTQIPDELLTEFLLWLSPETRQMLPLEGVEKTLEFAKRYKKVWPTS